MHFLKNKGKINYKSGVTLMELLVVTALIGILSSTIYVSFNTIKMRARDNQRVSDLNNISLAVRMYMQFNNNRPPFASDACTTNQSFCWFAQARNNCPVGTWGGNLALKLETNYIHKVPEDPKASLSYSGCATADGNWYYYGAGRKFDQNTNTIVHGGIYDYIICSKMEKTTNFSSFTSPWGHTLNYCVGS